MPLFGRPAPVVDGGGDAASGPSWVATPWSGPVPATLVYVDPDGVEWPWTDEAAGFITKAVTGLGAAPVSLRTLPLPGGGELPLDVVVQPSEPVVQLRIGRDDDDQDGYLGLVRRLRRALTHVRAGQLVPGTLRVAWPDGTTRLLDVYCTGGMPRDDATAENDGLTWGVFTLAFKAPDPYWRDATERQLRFALAPVGTGVPPLLPVNLAPSTVLGSVQVTIDGDVESYPRWVIHGPGTPTLVNETTGEQWALGVALGSAETLTVDAGPALQSVVDGTGADRWADLVTDPSPSLWALQPGVNDLLVQLAGAAEGSRVDLFYTARRNGA